MHKYKLIAVLLGVLITILGASYAFYLKNSNDNKSLYKIGCTSSVPTECYRYSCKTGKLVESTYIPVSYKCDNGEIPTMELVK